LILRRINKDAVKLVEPVAEILGHRNGYNGQPAIVGQFARDHGALVPDRLVTSAKSWLSNPHIDPKQRILPWQSDTAEEKLSPLECSRRYLQHLRDAFLHAELSLYRLSLEHFAQELFGARVTRRSVTFILGRGRIDGAERLVSEALRRGVVCVERECDPADKVSLELAEALVALKAARYRPLLKILRCRVGIPRLRKHVVVSEFHIVL
jgi:hypothetical protein